MRHYRSRALILCPVLCVVSRETAILFRFHGVWARRLLGWTTDFAVVGLQDGAQHGWQALLPRGNGPTCQDPGQSQKWGLSRRRNMMVRGERLSTDPLRANLDQLTPGRHGVFGQEILERRCHRGAATVSGHAWYCDCYAGIQ